MPDTSDRSSRVADDGRAQSRTRPDTHPNVQLATLSWTHFVNDGAANYLPGILPAILISLHVDPRLAGSIMAALLLGQALQPIYGWLSDRLGGRGLIFAGITGTTLGGALVGFAPNYASLLLVLLIIGVTNSMFHPQALAAVRQLAHRRRGLSMSVFLVGGELGRGIWPVLGSLVVMHFGMRALWILALPALLTLPFLWRQIPPLTAHPTSRAPIAWRRHLPDLTPIVAFSALRATVMFSLVTFIPLWWHAQGGSLVSGASLISTLLVTGIIGNLGGGHLADLVGRTRVLLGATLLSTLLLAGILLSPGIWLWPLLGLLGISVFALLPLTIMMGQDSIPEKPSLGAGLALGLANGLGAVAVLGLGLLVNSWGLVGILWFSVGLSALSAVLVLFLPKATAKTPSHAA